MNDKDQISMLNSRINSLTYQIKQLNDYKVENTRLKDGYEKSTLDLKMIRNEKDNIERLVTKALSSFKNLLVVRGKDYAKLKKNYNNDLLQRMQKDNNIFEEKIIFLERESKSLLDDLYNKVKQYCSNLKSGDSQDNNLIDIDAINYNLQNVLNEFNFVFNEIQEILDLSSRSIAEEEEETIRNLQTIEIIVEEIERLLQYVPNNQLIRNSILNQLRINHNNYPMNTPTIRIILTNMQEIKRKRQTELKNILDQIKVKSANILTKKKDIKMKIDKSMSQINKENKKKKSGDSLTLEQIFQKIRDTTQNNYDGLKNDVIDRLRKEIQEYKDSLEAKSLMEEDLITKVKAEFQKNWNQIREKGCNNIIQRLKNEAYIHFEPKLPKYQNYQQIVQVFQEKLFEPDCEVIKQSLLNCNETIDNIKNEIVPIKCVILLGKNDKYESELNEYLVRNLKYLVVRSNKSIDSFYNNIESSIKNLVSADSFNLVYPILILHFKEYKEFEKESNIETLIVKCFQKKVPFLFYFDIKNSKDLTPLNKKIKTLIEKSSRIQTALKDSKYVLSDNLACNFGIIEGSANTEMEKLVDFKNDIRCNIDKTALKNEYFEKMWKVYNTSHTKEEHLLNIKQASEELVARNRLLESIVEYALMSVNLNKQSKKHLKEKELISINQKIGAILDEIYNNNILKDFEHFIDLLINENIFSLYIEREELMAKLDSKYNTSLLIEEIDEEKIKRSIYQEIDNLIEKNNKKDCLKYVGLFIWYSYFDQFTCKFYKLFENGFKIPVDFDQYLVNYLNKKSK